MNFMPLRWRKFQG